MKNDGSFSQKRAMMMIEVEHVDARASKQKDHLITFLPVGCERI